MTIGLKQWRPRKQSPQCGKTSAYTSVSKLCLIPEFLRLHSMPNGQTVTYHHAAIMILSVPKPDSAPGPSPSIHARETRDPTAEPTVRPREDQVDPPREDTNPLSKNPPREDQLTISTVPRQAVPPHAIQENSPSESTPP